jgi:hypothetical protein
MGFHALGDGGLSQVQRHLHTFLQMADLQLLHLHLVVRVFQVRPQAMHRVLELIDCRQWPCGSQRDLVAITFLSLRQKVDRVSRVSRNSRASRVSKDYYRYLCIRVHPSAGVGPLADRVRARGLGQRFALPPTVGAEGGQALLRHQLARADVHTRVLAAQVVDLQDKCRILDLGYEGYEGYQCYQGYHVFT